MMGIPAYAGVARQGRFALAGLCLAGMSACTAQDAPPPANLLVDGLALKVYYEPDVFYPGPSEVRDGEDAIEPFPLTQGMVVARQDGKSLDKADWPKAQEAAEYYCQQRGGRASMGDTASLTKGDSITIWFFGGCTE